MSLRHAVVLMALSSACGSSQITTNGTGGGSAMMGSDGGVDAGTAGGRGGGMAGGSAGGRAGGSAVGGGAAGGSSAGGAAGGSSAGGAAGGSAGGVATCSSATCATGCCLNNTCQPGNQQLACGLGGAACTSCMGNDLCTNQVCGPNTSVMWRVRPTTATLDPTKPSGSGWDSDSGPDARVDMYCPAGASMATVRSTPIEDDETPMWTDGECTMTVADLMANGFAFQVIDRDIFAHDPISPKETVLVTMTDLAAGTVTVGPVGSCQSITFSLTRM